MPNQGSGRLHRAQRNRGVIRPVEGSSRDRLDHGLVEVAPLPGLTWLERADDGVSAVGGVTAGVLVPRRIAAADVPAGQAKAQVHPAVAQSNAFWTGPLVGDHYADLIQVLAKLQPRWLPPFLGDGPQTHGVVIFAGHSPPARAAAAAAPAPGRRTSLRFRATRRSPSRSSPIRPRASSHPITAPCTR